MRRHILTTVVFAGGVLSYDMSQRIPWRVVKDVGLLGGMKSLYYSMKFSKEPLSFIIGKKSEISIQSDSDIDINGKFAFGSVNNHMVSQSRSGSRLHISGDGRLVTTGQLSRIGAGSIVNIKGKFKIGDSVLNGDCRIYCENSITIGNQCAISWDVSILDTHGHELYDGEEMKEKTAPVDIGDNVLIGHDVSILPGVSINDGAVIGAKSLVNKDIPENALVAGNPAKILSTGVSWD